MSAINPTGTPTSSWTADEIWAYYERQPTVFPRYEFIDGELLVSASPAWRHADVQKAAYDRVSPYVDAQGIGRMYWSPADLRTATHTVVQPDLFVVPLPLPPPGVRQWSDVARFLLTIEVLSPSSVRYDRLVKRRLYARLGVPEYWIFDPDARIVERSFPDGRVDVVDETLVWHPDGARQPLLLDVMALYEDALGPGTG